MLSANAWGGAIDPSGSYEEAVYKASVQDAVSASVEAATKSVQKTQKKPEGIVDKAKETWGKLKAWVFSKDEKVAKEEVKEEKAVQETKKEVAKIEPVVEKTEAQKYLEKADRNSRDDIQNIGNASQAIKGQNVVETVSPAAAPKSVDKLVISKNRAPRYNKKLNVKIKDIPSLDIGREARIKASDFSVGDLKDALIVNDLNYYLKNKKALNKKDQKIMAKTNKFKVRKTPAKVKTKTKKDPKLVMTPEDIIALATGSLKNTNIQERAYKPMSTNEMLMLGALLLFRQKDECASAASLFHHLSKYKNFKNEAYFHLSVCAKRLKLKGDQYAYATKVMNVRDPYYTAEMAKFIGSDVPSEFLEKYGKALYGASKDKSLNLFKDPEIKNSSSLVISNWALQSKKYKLAIDYASKVDKKYDKYYQSLYLKAIGSYALGKVQDGIRVQKTLYKALAEKKIDKNFEALAALNLARMEFQSGLYVRSQRNFLQVYKDHPLWLPSLMEMGWAQLQSGDYTGAIGNMYSLHSPFFQHVYKPESYVIRTIGYLNLCQYGDAYRSLTRLEKMYRPFMSEIANYTKVNKQARTYYSTVKKYLRSNRKQKVDGLSPAVIREMARHRDFINLQKSLNRGIDERKVYNNLNKSVQKNINKYKSLISRTKTRIKKFKRLLRPVKKSEKRKPLTPAQIGDYKKRIKADRKLIASFNFILAIHKKTRKYLTKFKRDSIKALDKRNFKTKANVELVLAKRLFRMRKDLGMYLENNELLRYEVFAGSGENIRYQASGGKTQGKRIPANVIPKSKELKWDFDGEYWADEVGHYKSSLKSNCPKAGQANLGGM